MRAAQTLRLITEVNCRQQVREAQAAALRVCDLHEAAEEELQQVVQAKDKLQEEVSLLRSALQQVPGGTEQLQAMMGLDTGVQAPKQQRRLRWLWGWATR
jgi:hypothetical protein